MSSERFPKPSFAGTNSEQVPEIEIPAATEELFAAFDQLHDETIGQNLSPEEREKVWTQLHSLAEHFENHEMLTSYEDGTVPTFASMERAVALVDAHLAEGSDAESQKLQKLLSERVKEIRRWCSRYEQTIVVFHRKRKHMLFRGEDDSRDEFVRADSERRRTHDSLLSAIRSLDDLIGKANDLEKLPTPIARYEIGTSVPAGYAQEHPFIFSAQTASHENRDFIRDWSLVANLEQKLDAQKAAASLA